MFGFLLFTKKQKKIKSLEAVVEKIQQGDITLQNDLIHSYKPFIASTVSSVCKRYIHESDDEFSIGLIAFNEAIQKYSAERGRSLLSFAEVIIKRRVIDYIRTQSKYEEVSFNHSNEDAENESAASYIEDDLSIKNFHQKDDELKRKEEIIHFSNMLKSYDLSFQDLVKQSPKHTDARKNAMIVAKTLIENDEMKNLLLEKKKLPIKQLEKEVFVSRKTIERNRKYIIAISLILLGDYLYLKDYIKGVLET